MRVRDCGVIGFLLCGAAGLLPAQTMPRGITKPVQVRRILLSDNIGSPAFLASCPRAIAFLDFSDMTIHRFGVDGRRADRYTRVGRGPGELLTLGGMQFDGQCRLWTGDTGNSKILALDTLWRKVAELPLQSPVRGVTPLAGGTSIVAIPRTVTDMLHVLDATGRLTAKVPFPADIQSLNPIVREQYVARVNDSLAIVQFRWFDRRLLINARGNVLADFKGQMGGEAPRVIEMVLPGKGNYGYRVDPSSVEFARSIGMRGDTVLVIRGQAGSRRKDEPLPGRTRVLRVLATTGRVLDELDVPAGIEWIAATARGLFALGETDDGYVLYELR